MKISDIINHKNEYMKELDIHDLDTIFSYEGFAYIKTLNCKKMNECIEKIKKFKFNPKGVIVKIKFHEETPLLEVDEFMEAISKILGKEDDIVYGEEITESEDIEIILIFTGIDLI